LICFVVEFVISWTRNSRQNVMVVEFAHLLWCA